MLDGRKDYGWGYVGNGRKGFDWVFRPAEGDPCYIEGYPLLGGYRGGDAFPTRAGAVREGQKWAKQNGRIGTVEAVAVSGKYEF